MKPLDVVSLQIILDDDLIWRKREISDLISVAQTGTISEKRTARRASIPMLYAHWEGYTKNSFTRYFEFVSYRRKKFKDLSPNFFFLSAKNEISSLLSASPEIAIEKLGNILRKHEVINRDPMRKHVNTRSNLRWSVLEELYVSAGVEMPSIDLQLKIDKSLCDARNAIAHGSDAIPDLIAVKELRDEVFLMLDAIKNSLVTAAANDKFLNSASI